MVEYLLRANRFPDGVVLSTGTSLVPPLPFTLEAGDTVEIEIDEVGSLTNSVVRGLHASEWLVESMEDVRKRSGAQS